MSAALQGPEFYISKRVGKAITDYDMLSDRRSFVPIKYELLAVHIDLGYPCQHPKNLAKYFGSLGINYHIEKVDILKNKTRKDISQRPKKSLSGCKDEYI